MLGNDAAGNLLPHIRRDKIKEKSHRAALGGSVALLSGFASEIYGFCRIRTCIRRFCSFCGRKI